MENTSNNNDDRLPAKGKPPTRLQKRAPAALQLGDTIVNASVIVKCENNPSRSAIPLLSPLMLSPGPLLPLQPESIMNDEVQACQNAVVSTLGPVGGGWQHPAVVGALPEATNFFALFQSQCTLAQRSQ